MIKIYLAIYAIFVSLVFCDFSSFASTPQNLVSMKVNNSFDALKNCFDYHINPYSGRYILSRKQDELYFLTQKNSSKVFITKLNLSNFKHAHKVEIQSDLGLTLADMGGGFDGVSAFNLRKAPFGCGHGYSAGLGVIWNAGVKIVESHKKGLFKIVPSDSLSNVVVNLEKNMIAKFDAKTSQSRTYMKIPADMGLPLYVGLKNKQLFFVSNDGHKNQLVRYNSNLNRRDLVLALADDMKILQEGDQFALSQIKSDKVVVRFLPGWSETKLKVLSFTLPEEFLEQSPSLSVSFKSGIGVISAFDTQLQKSIAKVWVFGGNSKGVGKVVKADPGYYISQVIYDEQNDQFILLTNHIKTDDTGSIFVHKASGNTVLRVQWRL